MVTHTCHRFHDIDIVLFQPVCSGQTEDEVVSVGYVPRQCLYQNPVSPADKFPECLGYLVIIGYNRLVHFMQVPDDLFGIFYLELEAYL